MPTASDRRLANLLGAAALGVTDAMRSATTADGDLDEAAATTLVALLDFSPAGTVKRLSVALGLTHSGTVRLVDRLSQLGYVERRPGSDARSLTVALTDQGRARAKAIRTAREAALTATVSTLSRADRAALTPLLESIVTAITVQRLVVRRSGGHRTGGALCRLCDFTACGRPRGSCPAQSAAAAPSR